MTSLTAVLDKAAPFLSSALVSPESYGCLRRMGRRLPASLSHYLGLECRLSQAGGAVDLGIALSRAAGRAVLAGDHAGAALPEALFARPAWERARALAAAWADPRLPLDTRASTVWLEFDADDAPAARPPEPSLFLALPPRRGRGASAAAYYEQVTDIALPILLGGAVSEAVRRRLRICYEALPPEAYVAYIGVMVPRNTGLVRVGVTRFTAAEHGLAYLRNIGWAGATEALYRALAPHLEAVDDFVVCFEVGEQIGPKVAVELTLVREDNDATLAHAWRWRPLLDGLVAHGLCTPAKRDAGLAWNGASRVRGIENDTAFVLRFLHHVKIGYRPGSPLEAKGYFGLRYRERSAAASRVPASPPEPETALL